MNADQLLQWKADWDHVAARTRAVAVAGLDEVMAELGYERGEDGGWTTSASPVPAPRAPADAPGVPQPRRPSDRMAPA